MGSKGKFSYREPRITSTTTRSLELLERSDNTGKISDERSHSASNESKLTSKPQQPIQQSEEGSHQVNEAILSPPKTHEKTNENNPGNQDTLPAETQEIVSAQPEEEYLQYDANTNPHQYDQQYLPDDQYDQQQYDPNYQYDPNSTYQTGPNGEYIADPNQQYDLNPQDQYSYQNQEYNNDSNQQYAEEMVSQYPVDPNQQFTSENVSDPNQQLSSGNDQQYPVAADETSGANSNQQ